ncbi:LuxR C-terminal-related transcriptional regulator [Corynebacterium sp. 11266D000AW]
MPHPTSDSRHSRRHLFSALGHLGPGESLIASISGPAGAGKTELTRRILQSLSGWSTVQAAALDWDDTPLLDLIRARLLARSRHPHASLESVLDTPDAATLIIVDDAHWADPESLEQLVTLARRLTVGTMCLVFTIDATHSGTNRLPMPRLRAISDVVVDIPPLGAEEIQSLALTHLGVHLSPLSALSLQHVSGGRPSLVRQLLDVAAPDHWRDPNPLIRLPEAWHGALAARIDGRDLGDLLPIAALEHLHRSSLDLGLIEHLAPQAATNLEPALEAGILAMATDDHQHSVYFRHPTDRAVVRSTTDPARARRLHARAADYYAARDDIDAATFHRALSQPTDSGATAPQDLAERGAALGHAGRWRAAADSYRLAAHLADGEEASTSNTLSAIEALIAGSDIRQAKLYTSLLNSAGADPRVDSVRGYLALHEGRRTEARGVLDRAWDKLERDDTPDRSLRATVAARHTLYYLHEWRPERVLDWAQTTAQWSPANDAPSAEARYLSSFAHAILTGADHAGPALPHETPALAHRRAMTQGWLSVVHDDPVTASQLLRTTYHVEGSERIALWMDAWHARALLLMGDLDGALGIVERGLSRAEQFGIRVLEPVLLWTGSIVAHYRGDRELGRDYTNRLTLSQDAFLIQRIPSAMTQMHSAAMNKDFPAAVRFGRSLYEMGRLVDIGQPGFWPWEDIWAQQLLHAGDADLAEEVTSRAEERAAGSDILSVAAKLAVPRAGLLIQRGETAAGLKRLADAVEMIESRPLPFYQSRILFEYGRILRRLGRRRHADEIFGRAGEVYAAMGAPEFVERCNQERRASGLGRRTTGAGGLTPQEEEIAKAVADGASNREVAEELYLSTKTVEYHLTRVYRKLGIRSRNELPRALAHAGPDN